MVAAIVALAPLILQLGGWMFKEFLVTKPEERAKLIELWKQYYDQGLRDVQRRYHGESAKNELEEEWKRENEENNH